MAVRPYRGFEAQTAVRASTASLTVVAPPELAGRSVVIDPGGTVVGRGPSCRWAPGSDLVSRRHFVVRDRNGTYEVEDLGSTNGTRLNDTPVTDCCELHHGDRLTVADVEIEFRQPSADAHSHGDESAAPPPEARPRPLRQQLHQAPGFSVAALILAVGASVVTTVLTGAAGTGPWGTLSGALVAPLATTVFSTRRTGEKGRVRSAAIVILTLGALIITWSGFSLTDAVAGKSVVPGTDGRPGTFPGVPDAGAVTPKKGTSAPNPTVTPTTPTANQIVSVDPEVVQCGGIAVGSDGPCPDVTIQYAGGKRLHITNVEVTGPHAGDFTPGRECVGEWLDPGETCRMTVRFRPSGATDRRGTLVIHQNLPRPDRGTEARLTGNGISGGGPDPDTCLAGYVWREAVAGDHVCVAPEIRDQTRQDNRLADSRRDPQGGAYGPDTCLVGFVWREAVAGDHVCVTPGTRNQAQQDNSLAAGRRVGR